MARFRELLGGRTVTLDPDAATREFFDDMASRYDSDLVDVGWDPVECVERWPLAVPAGASVLDAGCGTGLVLEHLAGAGRKLAGFDLSPSMIRQARRKRKLRSARLVVGSASGEWPYPNESFDTVICLAMLEFVERLDTALEELTRVLKVGGTALFSVEDLVDYAGNQRDPMEMRYDEFPLWRRTREELELSVPASLELQRVERQAAYTVLELGFTCAYHVVEARRIS